MKKNKNNESPLNAIVNVNSADVTDITLTLSVTKDNAKLQPFEIVNSSVKYFQVIATMDDISLKGNISAIVDILLAVIIKKHCETLKPNRMGDSSAVKHLLFLPSHSLCDKYSQLDNS
jgi:chorismate mutase